MPDRYRQILVDGLIGAYDLSADLSVQAHIAQVLARVGIERVVIDPGTKFDAKVCEAVSTMGTDDPSQYSRVAETIRPGWVGTGTVLRPPQVAVWISSGAGDWR